MVSPSCPRRITALAVLPLLDRSSHFKSSYMDLLIEHCVIPFLIYVVWPEITMLYISLVVLGQIVLSPIERLATYTINRNFQYKFVKSTVGFWGIVLGYGLGLGMGLVLVNSAFSWSFVVLFASTFHVNLSVTMLLGLLMARTKLLGQARFDYLLGAGIGIVLGPIMGMASSAWCVVDLMVLSASVVALAMGIILKETIRAVYKLRYGHSNVDGYLFVLGNRKIFPVDRVQADVFEVTPSDVRQLRCSLFQLIQVGGQHHIPHQKTIPIDVKRVLKNMFYLFMTANVQSARYCRKLLMVNARFFHTYKMVREALESPSQWQMVQTHQLFGSVHNHYFKMLIKELTGRMTVKPCPTARDINTAFHRAACNTRQFFLQQLPQTLPVLSPSVIAFEDFSQLYQFVMVELLAGLGQACMETDGGYEMVHSHFQAVQQFDVQTKGDVMP